MEINLISDTITKPSYEMLQYMFNAQVGDDVYKQDPTVIELETRVAEFLVWKLDFFSVWNYGKSNGNKTSYAARRTINC